MEIRFLGHAGFLVSGSKKILIDPWITENPSAAVALGDLSADYIFVTHDHFDHSSDVEEIQSKTGAKVVGIFDYCQRLEAKGIPTVGGNLGGRIRLDGLELVMTPAFHTMSSNPSGVVLMMDGKTIYHSGDTSVFSDMRLIGELYPLDLAMLPIGGHFTMGIAEAVKAVELLGVKKVIPMHYNTFDLIKADPREFAMKLGNRAKAHILEPGQSYELV